MPGSIIKAIARCGVQNPVILLDEIDKLTESPLGNPAAALLELLDPEQNKTFKDHYLDVPFDLSQVFWVCTSNSLSMPAPLLDRLEIIGISGYTESEKLEIAKRYLIPKQRKRNAMESPFLLNITDDALRTTIRDYTAESGVRGLERRIAQVCRWAVLVCSDIRDENVEDVKSCLKESEFVVGPAQVKKLMGISANHDPMHSVGGVVGIAIGLAVTGVGGRVLFVEASKSQGKGKIQVTGQLGSVMSESVYAAFSFIKARASERGTDIASKLAHVDFEKIDLHVHFPDGATPKDGPSAGVAIVLAITSVLAGVPCRDDSCCTGEISLHGLVLPIGGVKEKVLAAHRQGLKHVFLPAANKQHVDLDVPEDVKKDIAIHFVQEIDEVLSWHFGWKFDRKELISRNLVPVESGSARLKTFFSRL
jgi:ATP-dependent Lon protease